MNVGTRDFGYLKNPLKLSEVYQTEASCFTFRAMRSNISFFPSLSIFKLQLTSAWSLLRGWTFYTFRLSAPSHLSFSSISNYGCVSIDCQLLPTLKIYIFSALAMNFGTQPIDLFRFRSYKEQTSVLPGKARNLIPTVSLTLLIILTIFRKINICLISHSSILKRRI